MKFFEGIVKGLGKFAKNVGRFALKMPFIGPAIAAAAVAKAAQGVTIATQTGFAKWVTDPLTGKTKLFDDESIMQTISSSFESLSNGAIGFILGPLASAGNSEPERKGGKKDKLWKKLTQKEQDFWKKVEAWHNETIKQVNAGRKKAEAEHPDFRSYKIGDPGLIEINKAANKIIEGRKTALEDLLKNSNLKPRKLRKALRILQPTTSALNAATEALNNAAKKNQTKKSATSTNENNPTAKKSNDAPSAAPGPPLSSETTVFKGKKAGLSA